jgi:PIN domain nuclease of toxin-antitoxin system
VNILLDTCSLIWTLTDSKELSIRARTLIVDPKNVIHVSAVSIMEISVKHSLGKLSIKGLDPIDLPRILYERGVALMTFDPFEAAELDRLPSKKDHRDPFDRMLVCQAIYKNLTLISSDRALAAYREDGLSLIS